MKNNKSGFSLVELLISMTILSLILTVLAYITSSTLKSWRSSTDEQLKFRNAKNAYDAVFTRLATAELNPYWGYEFGNGASRSPTSYKKLSDLHFVCGGANTSLGVPLIPDSNRLGHAVFFHGAFGVTEEDDAEQLGLLINSWGYFLEFGPDEQIADFLESEGDIDPRYRFRLMELQVKSENVSTFQNQDGEDMDLNEATSPDDLYEWFRDPIDNPEPGETNTHMVAENIIALVFAPLPPNVEDSSYDEASLAPDYFYDTRAFQHSTGLSTDLLSLTEHQLPPIVRVTMVAITEGSAVRLEEEFGTNMPNLGVDSLFKNLRNYDADIETLKNVLNDRNIEFQIFTDTVKLRNSKWSSQLTEFL